METTTLRQQFKTLIESETHRIVECNPLLIAARRGTLTKDEVRTYLHNLTFFFRHTPIHLKRAQQQAAQMGKLELAGFFQEKINEESGHDFWPQNDLKKLGFADNQLDFGRITAGNMKLLAFAKDIIDEDPALFIPYMLFLEYFTVLAAPAFLENLESKCEIPRSAMTSIAYHEKLDVDHVAEDFDVLDMSAKQTSVTNLERALKGTIDCFERMIGECVTAH